MKRLRCLFSFLLALIFACIPLQVILAASEAVRLAPTVNLYKRLVPGYEAPAYVGWAQSNRSALILIPRYTEGRDKSMRAELRFPDPSSNPYLAFAAMLAAALDGIDKKMTPPAPLNNVNLYELNREERREMGGIRPPVRIFILRSAVAQSPCVRASPSQLDILPFPPRLEPSPTHALAAPASLTQTM